MRENVSPFLRQDLYAEAEMSWEIVHLAFFPFPEFSSEKSEPNVVLKTNLNFAAILADTALSVTTLIPSSSHLWHFLSHFG